MVSFFGRLNQTTIQFLQQINGENVHPVSGAGIRTLDLKSYPITTRPQLLTSLSDTCLTCELFLLCNYPTTDCDLSHHGPLSPKLKLHQFWRTSL